MQKRIKEISSGNGSGVKNGQEWIKEILEKITPDAKIGSIAFMNW
ncbi:Uncharacterised protein, partial [Mycoplasma putrefaciens]